jgi:hypothetical protein
MNASPVLANVLQRHLNEVRAGSDFHDADEPVRVLPVLSSDELPTEFEHILQIQVLGYRQRLDVANGCRLLMLEPVWTLVPKDR